MEYIETGIQGFRLRFAEKGDTALILRFIRELALYENELDQVEATEEILSDSLFDRKGAEVVIGEYNSEPVGFALFFTSFSTFLGKPGINLVDLYIVPGMRERGFGKKMLSYLAKLTVERGCGRLEWWCHDWNAPAIKLYRRWGAFPIDNIRVYRLCENALVEFSGKF